MARPPGSAGGSPADREWHNAHRGWRDRRYVPHFDAPGVIQMITYRLADALPADVVRRCLQMEPNRAERRKHLEKYLDAGHGCCILRRPEIATVVVDNWMQFDGSRYDLVAWVVMPNHVHVLIDVRLGYPIPRIVHSWKSFTAKMIGRVAEVQGRLWQPDYWDRVIRNETHFVSAVEYILRNPVTAGLACRVENWAWSRARNA